MDSQLDTQEEDLPPLAAHQLGGYQVASDAAALKQVGCVQLVHLLINTACGRAPCPPSASCDYGVQALIDEKSAPELLQHKADLLQSIEQRLAEQVGCV